ncbi:hypothetical protein D3C72_1831710 [compost metagenome]
MAISPSLRTTLSVSAGRSRPRLASAASPWSMPKRTQAALSSVSFDLENTAYFFRSASCGSSNSLAMARTTPSPSSRMRKLDCIRPFCVQRAPRLARESLR